MNKKKYYEKLNSDHVISVIPWSVGHVVEENVWSLPSVSSHIFDSVSARNTAGSK